MANKITKKDFERMMGRLQEEDYITSDEFYSMFNKVIEAVKQARINSQKAIIDIDSAAQKRQKELDKHFVKLLQGVDKRMKQVRDGAPGKDGTTPIAGVDYPDYKEVRDFITKQVEALPKPELATDVITVDYIKAELEALEGHDRLKFTAIDGLQDEIETQFRKLDAATSRGPKFVHGGVNVSGGTTTGGLSSPLTTKGDLWGYSTTNARVPIGADNTVLTADSSEALGVKWAVPAGGGDVAKVGTPADGQVGVWTGDGTIEGDADLTFDGDTLSVTRNGNGVTAQFINDVASGNTGAGMAGYSDDGAATASGTRLGYFLFGGANDGASTMANAAMASAYATENWSGVQNGAELRFEITNNGATSRSEALRIQQDGSISMDGGTTSITATELNKLDGITGTIQVEPAEGGFADGDKTKLDGIEAGADVTDTANVTSAGALMDSELTDLAGVKALDTSTLQVKPSEGAFVDGDKTKLDGIETGADVTDTANVTAAGALMDSEVTNLAQVKAFDSSDYATAAQGSTADSAMQDLVDDTTPQLGGSLDCNGNEITDVQGIKIDGTPDADHSVTGPYTDTFNAGETVTAFAAVSMKSDGEWHYADADETGTVDRTFLGVSLEAGTDGNPLEVALSGSFVRDDTWNWTVGGAIYVGTTPGQLTQTAPSATDNEVRVVGYAVSADVMRVEPTVAIVHA